MSFNLFRTIFSGGIKEFLVVGADPANNYRFIMNAQNKDGVSPWSNMVEWGARRKAQAAFWNSISDCLVRSEYALPSLPAGVWGTKLEKVTDIQFRLKLFRAALDWDGTDSTILLSHYIPIESLLNTTLTVDAKHTLYPIRTQKSPVWFIKHQGEARVDLIRVTLPLESTPTYEVITFTGGAAEDYLVMDDATVLLKRGGLWYAVRPSAAGSYRSTPTSLATSFVAPYLLNSYPLSLNTTVVNISGTPTPTVRYLSSNPDIRYANNQVTVSTKSMNMLKAATLIHADWDALSAYGLLSERENLFWVSEGAGTPTGVVLSEASSKFTNTAGWSGLFVYGEDLFVYGRSSATVAEAPDTPAISGQIVNLHRMDQTKNTGLTDYTDVGPNLFTFQSDLPSQFNGQPVVKVKTNATETGDPKDFVSLIVMNDGSVSLVSSELTPPSIPYWFDISMLYNSSGGGG